MTILGKVTWPLFLIGGLGLALLLLWVWLRRGRIVPGRWARFGFWTCEAALGGLSLWFSWRLGAPMYFLIFAAMILPLLRLWQDSATQTARSGHAAVKTGRISILQSPWLILRLAHDNGACTGQMLRGKMLDWQLHEMDSHDLQQTRMEMLHADPNGTALFDWWLDRYGPMHWRKDFGKGTEIVPVTPAAPQLTRDEAAALLGLEPQAPASAVDAAAARLQDLLGKDPRHAFIASWIAAARTALTA